MVYSDTFGTDDFGNTVANKLSMFFSWAQFHNPPLMQFTGLSDRDGKEIYEGDILHGMAEVIFSNEMGCFTIKHATMPLGGFLPGESVVIGNMYENPELLWVGSKGTN